MDDDMTGAGAGTPGGGQGEVSEPPASAGPPGTAPFDNAVPPPAPPPFDPGHYQWVPATAPPGRPPGGGLRRAVASPKAGWVVSGLLACVVVGLAIAIATTPAATPASSAARSPASGSFRPGGGTFPGGGAFPGFGGGAAGTVDSVSSSSFTMTTRTGEKYTVEEQSSTSYRSGSATASQSAVTTGARVLVVGSTSGGTIRATQVVILPSGGGGFGFQGA